MDHRDKKQIFPIFYFCLFISAINTFLFTELGWSWESGFVIVVSAIVGSIVTFLIFIFIGVPLFKKLGWKRIK